MDPPTTPAAPERLDKGISPDKKGLPEEEHVEPIDLNAAYFQHMDMDPNEQEQGGKRKRRTKRRKSLKKKRKTKRKTNKRKSLKKRRKTKRKGG